MNEYEKIILDKINNNIPLTKVEENYQLLKFKISVEKAKEVKVLKKHIK